MNGIDTRSLRRFAVAAAIAILAACQSWPRGDLPEATLSPHDTWSFTGKLGVRSETDKANLQVHWVQAGDRYRILLRGPLGQGVARIEGVGRHVTFEAAGREAVEADDVETLFARVLGWRFPVAEILYWLEGEPAPGSAAEFTRDSDGRLQELRQGDWAIRFERYQGTRPIRIRFDRAGVELLLVIRQWNSGPEA